MSDLLKRLRAKSADYRAAKSPAWGDLMAEAADRIRELEQLLRQIEPYIDSLVCYASTVAEYPPNGLPDRVRAALARSAPSGEANEDR